eukprot:m.73674 g.73674  ORF g.73674 m.73674 type:complete len:98 (+) comp12372_c0_seq2:2675-2968(+)
MSNGRFGFQAPSSPPESTSPRLPSVAASLPEVVRFGCGSLSTPPLADAACATVLTACERRRCLGCLRIASILSTTNHFLHQPRANQHKNSQHMQSSG